jgi:hypothetical protein
MKRQLSRLGAVPGALLALLALVTTGVVNPTAASAHPVPAWTSSSGTVLQTNLVSDLPGVAATTDPNLVNAWGISESSGSPFWISDNNSGLTTLYNVLTSTSVTINPLVVNIPTPVGPTGGTPTGTVFNIAPSTSNAFQVTGPNKAGLTTTASALFLFDTEDGTIVGWNPTIDPTGQFGGPGGTSNHAVIALDNSGNNFTNPDPNQQTGSVYKGLAIATSTTPILTGDANSTALLYASNFRAGTVEVYDTKFVKATPIPRHAFQDRQSPTPCRTRPSTTTWPGLITALSTSSTSTGAPGYQEVGCAWSLAGRSTRRGGWLSPQRASPGSTTVATIRCCWSAISATGSSTPSTRSRAPRWASSGTQTASQFRSTAFGP